MKRLKLKELKRLLGNDERDLVFFLQPDGSYYATTSTGKKIVKTLDELQKSKAVIWKEEKTY